MCIAGGGRAGGWSAHVLTQADTSHMSGISETPIGCWKIYLERMKTLLFIPYVDLIKNNFFSF